MNSIISLNEDQRDCLQEIINIAMGQAGDLLARFLSRFVQLSIPKIKIVPAQSLVTELVTLSGLQARVSGVRQSFYALDYSLDLNGDAIVVFDEHSLLDMTEIILSEKVSLAATSQERLLDVSSLLTDACLESLAAQLELSLGVSPPQVLGENISPEQLLAPIVRNCEQALLVQIAYTIEGRSFHCYMFFVVQAMAVDQLRDILDQILEDV